MSSKNKVNPENDIMFDDENTTEKSPAEIFSSFPDYVPSEQENAEKSSQRAFDESKDKESQDFKEKKELEIEHAEEELQDDKEYADKVVSENKDRTQEGIDIDEFFRNIPQYGTTVSKAEPEPEAAKDEPEPEAAKDEPEPEAAKDEPEPEAAKDEPEPEAAKDEPEPEAAKDEPEPEAAKDEPEPEAAKDEPEPEAAKDEPEPEAAKDEPEPEAAKDEPEPEAAKDEPEPEAAKDKPEPEAAKDEPEPEAAKDEPEPEAAKDEPEPEAAKDEPEPEAAKDEPEPEAAKDEPEPEAAKTESESNEKVKSQKYPFANLNNIESDHSYESSEIVSYQKYLLALKELSLTENTPYFDEYVKKIVDIQGLDPKTATIDDLMRVDVALSNSNLELLQSIAPEVVESTERKIQSENDVWELMESAGYDLRGSESNIPIGFLEDVQVMQAFDKEFPDPERTPLIDRLRSAKDRVVEVAKSDNARLGMATVAFGLACSAGTAALPIAAGLYAAKLMENKGVQDLMNKVHDKTSSVLEKLGFKKKDIGQRKERLGDKLKAISDSKWGKIAKVGAAASLCGFGLYSALDASGFSFSKVPEYASNLKDAALNAPEHLANAKESLASMVANGSLPKMLDFELVRQSLGYADKDLASEFVSQAQAISDGIAPSDYTINSGDNLWDVVGNYYKEKVGTDASPQQIVAIINNMDVPDPSNIKPGEVVTFPSDLSKFDSVGKVEADWLGSVDEVADSVGKVEADWLVSVDEVADSVAAFESGSISISKFFDINEIAGADVRISDIMQMNPDVDLTNLMPGDEVALPDGSKHTVPSLEDAVLQASFGENPHPFVDKDKLLDLIDDANPNIDLTDSYLGIFGNQNVGADIAASGNLVTPDIDLSQLTPKSGDAFIQGPGTPGNSSLNRAILNAAYPDGVPELLDRSAILTAIKEANPQLGDIRHRESFAMQISIPELSATPPTPDSELASVTIGASENNEAKEKFMKKFLSNQTDREMVI